MGNKARNYGLPTQDSINEVVYGSSNYIQTQKLDRLAVNTAISRVVMPYFNKLATFTNTEAAHEVADELRRAGFPDIHVLRSIVYDKNVKFKVVRLPHQQNVFVAVGEKQKKK